MPGRIYVMQHDSQSGTWVDSELADMVVGGKPLRESLPRPSAEYTLLPPGSVIVDGERLRGGLITLMFGRCPENSIKPECAAVKLVDNCVACWLAYLAGSDAAAVTEPVATIPLAMLREVEEALLRCRHLVLANDPDGEALRSALTSLRAAMGAGK